MSSNLYKSGWFTVQSEKAKIIDNNALMETKLKQAVIRKKEPLPQSEGEEGGFASGLSAEEVDGLLTENGAETVIKKRDEAEELREQIEAARQELEQVKEQTLAMQEAAKEEIAAMKSRTLEEAKRQGYEEGRQQGMAEAEALKKEYLSEKKQMEQEYEQLIQELEPAFVENLTDIYEHIFKVDLSSYRELVTNLLIENMQKISDTRNFMIHVSKEDYPSVSINRDRILAETGTAGVNMEIIEDMTLASSQCLIETETGVYDCSLGTELEELGRKLKLLSYHK